MPAYIIADVTVTDPSQYEEYKVLSSKSFEAHDVHVLVRGGVTERLEGREPMRTVILEFEDHAAARKFYDSEEYQRAKTARQGAAVMNMFIVDGI